MRLATLDEITRRGLIESGLPIHYYFEYLTHGATCLRELSFDTLKIVNTVHLPVNEYGAVDLPDDFVDDVSMGFYGNGVLQPLPHINSISPIRNHDEQGRFVHPSIPTNNVTPINANNVNSGNDLFLGGLAFISFCLFHFVIARSMNF